MIPAGAPRPARPRRADPADYRALDLHAHALLRDVPLHDVWQVALPGGGPDRSLADLRALMSLEEIAARHRVVAWLFRLRAWLGGVLGWDAAPGADPSAFHSDALGRVPDAVRARSDPPPGTPDGPFVLLYALERESLGEIRNATVHAFSVLALRPDGDGYRAFWAVHVAPVGPISRLYMALIDPFRRFLVYPTILRHVQSRWIAVHARAGHAPDA